MTIAERFWSKVDKKGPEDCWEWQAGKFSNGYGQFQGGDVVGAHRLAWELYNECKVPEGMLILHSCDNPSCCNPNHLRCGTGTDNSLDMMARNRGRRSGIATATILLVRGLQKFGFSQRHAACLAEVSQQQVGRIWNSIKFPSKEGAYV